MCMENMLNTKKNIRSTSQDDQRPSTGHPSGRPLQCYEGVYQGPYQFTEEDEKEYIEWLQYVHVTYLLPKFDIQSLIQDFPEAKEFIIKKLEGEINNARIDIEQANKLEPIYHDIIYIKSSTKDEEYWKALVNILFLDPLRVEQEKTIKKNQFILSQLKGQSKTKNLIGVTPEEITQAKQFPVTSLIDFKKNVAICPFHGEKTPSLHYYPRSNTIYCFGACQKSFDSIEVYRLLNDCSFVEAVRKLQ